MLSVLEKQKRVMSYPLAALFLLPAVTASFAIRTSDSVALPPQVAGFFVIGLFLLVPWFVVMTKEGDTLEIRTVFRSVRLHIPDCRYALHGRSFHIEDGKGNSFPVMPYAYERMSGFVQKLHEEFGTPSELDPSFKESQRSISQADIIGAASLIALLSPFLIGVYFATNCDGKEQCSFLGFFSALWNGFIGTFQIFVEIFRTITSR